MAERFRWKKDSFTTQTASGLIRRTGYVCRVFGIEKDQGWTIYHIPTGMSFLYSNWPNYRDARNFAEALLRINAWNTRSMSGKVLQDFTKACAGAAKALGYEERAYRRLS